MEENERDKEVPKELAALMSDERLILRETKRAGTPFGGVAVFIAYLSKIQMADKIREHMPVRWRSHNQIDPAETFTAFMISVLLGAKRFAHSNWLRGDRALHALLGLKRFSTGDTIRNLFKKFTMGNVERLFPPLLEWQMERVPVRPEGYSLDLDSTVLERYGQPEGSLKGYNPRRHARPSHQPGSCCLSRRSLGAMGTAPENPSGQSRFWILRRRTVEFPPTAQSALHCSCPHDTLGETRSRTNRAVARTGCQLCSGRVSTETAWLGERQRESRASVGRKLIHVPGYTFRIFATNRDDAPELVWRDYNRRADMENRIAELKHDLGVDHFCLKQFHATEAAFRTILLLFNLLAEFQRAAGLPSYSEPATIRTQSLTCGAILGRSARRIVVHLGESWGGLKTRNPLLTSILDWQIPTSPKFSPLLRC